LSVNTASIYCVVMLVHTLNGLEFRAL